MSADESAGLPCIDCGHPREVHVTRNAGRGDHDQVPDCAECPPGDCGTFVEPEPYDPASDHDPLPGLRIRTSGHAAAGGADG